MRPLTVFISTLLAVNSAQLPAATNILENDYIRFEVSQQNGSIIHLIDKRTGTDYIGDQSQSRLFRLLLPRPPDNLARRIMSNEQKPDSILVENERLRIHFAKLSIAGQRVLPPASANASAPYVDIEATVTFRLDGPHVVANLELKNASDEQITDVTFPWLGGLALVSDGQRARIVHPSVSRKVVSTTATFLFPERAKSYPSELATSWVNYEFKDKGVGIEVRSAPETQDALISLTSTPSEANVASGGGGNAYIAWNFYPHVAGQSRWASPDAVIHLHGADWHTIAGEHREWYRQQFSPPRGSEFDRAIGFATYRLKKDDNTVNWSYDQIPALAEEAKSAGIRHVLIDGWREREGPANPYPFGEIADIRMGGGPRLRALNERLGKEGVVLAFAFHPTLLNTAAQQYKDGAFRWAVKTRVQGHLLSPFFVFISQDYPYEYSGMHYSAQIDPASPATDYLMQEAKRLKEEYGFRNLFLRGVGLQSFLSYNKEDSVLPQEAYLAGYKRFLGGLKKIYPDGIFIMEGFNDLVNAYSSAGYTWGQRENAEVLSLSVPWTPFSNEVEALDYDQANASFARKILINLIVDGGDGSVGRYRDFAGHLKRLQGLKESTVPYYAEAEFRDHEGLKNAGSDAGVLISTFHNGSSHQVGIVLANLTRDKKEASFELDERLLSMEGRIFRLRGEPSGFALSPKANLTLGPYDVVIIGIDPKK